MLLVTFFVGGLQPDLKSELKFLQLATLRQAFSAAKIYEVHPGHCQSMWKGLQQPFQGSTSSPSLLKTPTDGNRSFPVVRKTLTVEERRVRMARGLCFNCDETYSPRHRYKGKLFKMDTELGCLIEMCEEPI